MIQFVPFAAAALAAAIAHLQPADPSQEGEKIEWLRTHSAPLRPMVPDNVDLSDLLPLKEAIGDTRLVMLGEQTHGDGATFHAKARLIMFLHQEMGFDVLAWESGTFDCRRMDDALLAGEPEPEASLLGPFALWSQTEQVRPLLEYIAAHRRGDHPLEVAGFDPQFSSSRSRLAFAGHLFAFFDAADPALLDAEMRSGVQDAIEVLGHRAGADRAADRKMTARTIRARKLIEDDDGLLSIFERAAAQLTAAHGERETAFMRRCITNLQARLEQQLQLLRRDIDASVNVRCQRMGENMIWLARERYPDRKIILWGSCLHFADNVQSIRIVGEPTMDYSDLIGAGVVAARELDGEVYRLAFTSREGHAGYANRKPMKIAPPRPESLEGMLHTLGEPYLFLNLRTAPADHWLRQPLTSRLMGHQDTRAIWPDIFDGFIYIEQMYPATPR